MTTLAGPPETLGSILDAAEETFGRLGFRATTMGEVASAAGVSRPLVHRYFGDKETLYREVVERLLREWNEALVAVAERRVPTTGHTLRAVMEECVSWAHDREMLRGVLLRDADVTRRVAGGSLDEGRNRLPRLLANLLAEGVARGDIRADLPVGETAAVLSDVIVAGSVQTLAHVSDETDEAFQRRVEAMIEVALHGVVVSPLPGAR